MAGESIGSFNDLIAPGDSDRPPPAPSTSGSNAPIGDFVPLDRSPLKTSYKQVPSRDNGSGSLWGDFTRGVGLGTRNVIEGVSALPGQIVDAATYLTGGRAVARALGGSDAPPSEWLQTGMNKAGLPTPQTPREQLIAEGVRGGASMLTPMGLSSMAPKLVAKAPAMLQPFISMEPGSAAQAAATVAAGGAGGAAGDLAAASEYVPEWLKPTARLAGNVAGNVGVNTLARGVGTLANAFKGKQSEIADALDRLGIKPRTAGAVSESPTVQGTEALTTRIPLASGVLQPAQRQMVDDFGTAVERTARLAETATDPKLAGVATTPQNTGTKVQGYIRNWIDQILPDREAAIWNPVNDTMRSKGDVVVPSGYRTALEKAASDVRLSDMPATQKAFTTGKIQEWLDALNKDAPAGSGGIPTTAQQAFERGDVQGFLKALEGANSTPPTQISWDAAHAIKQRIGDAMGTPDLVGSIGDKALKSIYAGLAEDMGMSAIQHGVGPQYQAANQFSTAARNVMDNSLSKAVRTKNALLDPVKPEDATENLLNGTATDHQFLRQHIPEAADLLAAYKLRQAAQAKPSQQGAGDTTSTGTFLTTLRRSQLDNPEGTSALFADPEVAARVKDLGTVAGQFRGVEKNMNTSNTAAGIAAGAASSKFLDALMSGDAKQIAAALAILGGPYATSKVLTAAPVIGVAKAQRAAPPLVPGLLGGAISNQATTPRYDYEVRP